MSLNLNERADFLAHRLLLRDWRYRAGKADGRKFEPNSIELKKDWAEFRVLSSAVRFLLEHAPPANRELIRRRIGEAVGNYSDVDEASATHVQVGKKKWHSRELLLRRGIRAKRTPVTRIVDPNARLGLLGVPTKPFFLDR